MNLIVFFGLLAQYQVPIQFVSDKAKHDIYQMLYDSNTIWQKFAQMLAQFIMANDAESELGQMLEGFYANCPRHNIEYTKRVLLEELPDLVDEETVHNIQFIASGTVSQTYSLIPKGHLDIGTDRICIKVQHPGVAVDIQETCDLYDAVKNSYFFPKKFKGVCKLFFESLRDQCNTRIEFESSNQYADMLQQVGMKHRVSGRDLVVTPRMIAYTNRCLVMEYMPSKSVSSRDIHDMYREIGPKNVIRYYKLAATIIPSLGYFTGVYHLDLHVGNLGYTYNTEDDTIQIVVYDLGQYVYMDYTTMGLDDETIYHFRNTMYACQQDDERRREWTTAFTSPEGQEWCETNNMFDTTKTPAVAFLKIAGIKIVETEEYLRSPYLLPILLSIIKAANTNICKLLSREHGHIPDEYWGFDELGRHTTSELDHNKLLFPPEEYDMGMILIQTSN
jgi:predicted unusual protein kinase regulating ubiquinone biosynthesis (AarF/ABC1/UbiB family)